MGHSPLYTSRIRQHSRTQTDRAETRWMGARFGGELSLAICSLDHRVDGGWVKITRRTLPIPCLPFRSPFAHFGSRLPPPPSPPFLHPLTVDLYPLYAYLRQNKSQKVWNAVHTDSPTYKAQEMTTSYGVWYGLCLNHYTRILIMSKGIGTKNILEPQG